MKYFSKLLPALKSRLVISIIGIVVIAACGSYLTYELTKAEVTVTQSGDEATVLTHADTVSELLQNLGIEPKEHDEVSHNSDALIKSGMNINYKKAKKVTVAIDEEEKDYFTTANTVGEFVKETKLEISEHDKVSHENGNRVEDGMELHIDKAFQVTVNDGGEKRKIWTIGGTVASFLQAQEIKLNDLDKIKPEKSQQLSKDNPIRITRVEKVTDVVEETKDYHVVTKKDESLDKGKEEIVSPGEKGVIVKHFEVTLENGKEVNRELIKEEVKKDSKERVVAVGTKEEVVVASAKANPSTDENSSSSKETNTVSRNNEDNAEVLYMHATAYSADCSGCSGVTATGINLNDNPNKKVVAVDPSVIPLGSKVWVEGYGYAIAGDTGGAINGNRIDLHVPTRSAAHSFGSKNVQVKVIE